MTAEQLFINDAQVLFTQKLTEQYLLDFLSPAAAESIVEWLARDAAGFPSDEPIEHLLQMHPLRSHALGSLLSREWQDKVNAACQDAIEEHWLPWKLAHPPLGHNTKFDPKIAGLT